MTLSIDEFRVLADRWVREHGGVTLAAKRLGISQPLLTQFLSGKPRETGKPRTPPRALLKELGYRPVDKPTRYQRVA